MRSRSPVELTKLVLKTPYFKCNPGADTEIHSLTGHSHLFMYIAAIKSLLRFHNDIAIILHSDGSLKNTDKMLLEKHIRGIEIIEKKVADKKMARILRHFPNCKKYRVANIISIQLLDYAVFSKTGKIVSLDSDTLFMRRPSKLIDWISNGKKEIVYFYEIRPCGQAEFLSEINCDFPPHVCAGFLCFHKQIVALNKIEKILARMKNFGWFTTQNALPVLIKNKSKEYKISFFNTDKYQDPRTFQDGAIFRHYWTSFFTIDKYIGDFIKVILEITKTKDRE